MLRRAALALLLLAMASPTGAKVPAERLGDAHFAGLWSMDGPAGCIEGDTLSFYATGLFAVTNGGRNPVEALGTWEIADGVLRLKESKVEAPLAFEEAEATVDALQEGRMDLTITYADGRSQSYTLDRCP